MCCWAGAYLVDMHTPPSSSAHVHRPCARTLCTAGRSTQLHLASHLRGRHYTAACICMAYTQDTEDTVQHRQPSGRLQLQRPLDRARWLLCRLARHSICHLRWLELKPVTWPGLRHTLSRDDDTTEPSRQRCFVVLQTMRAHFYPKLTRARRLCRA